MGGCLGRDRSRDCSVGVARDTPPAPSVETPPPAGPEPVDAPVVAPFSTITPSGTLLSTRRLDPEQQFGPDTVVRFPDLGRVVIDAIEYDSAGVVVEGFVVTVADAPPRPAVIYARGGGAQTRARIGAFALAKHLAPLALAGFTVVGTQYRAQPHGQDEFGGQELEDLVHLRALVTDLAEVGGSKVGLVGWSRGAMMVHLALAHAPTAFSAAIAAAGVADQDGELRRRPEMETVFEAQIPDYLNSRADALARRSPALWAERLPRDVPILLLHGTSDRRVAAAESLRMAGRLQDLGVPYRLMMFDGGGHGIFEHEDEVQAQIAGWFSRHLA